MKSILTIIFSFLLVVSGLAQTRNVVVGTNDVIVQPTNFWSANASNGRTGLGLGSAATNPASAFQPSSLVLSNLSSSNGINITNLQSSNIVGAISVSNFIGTLAIASGGTGATNAGGARTNLGLGASNNVSIGEDGGSLTTDDLNAGNVNVSTAVTFTTNSAATLTRINLGFSTNLNALWLSTNAANARNQISAAASTIQGDVANEAMVLVDDDGASPRLSYEALGGDGWTISDESGFRSAINLSLPALTNTNNANFLSAFFGSNTNPVLVNTNGTVVSPTNFWQVAPIQTLVQDFTLIGGTQTNNATNARNLYVYSLNTNLVGVSNTIILPTNTSTFNGDEITVVHQGTTNATTVVRQAGSTNNLITLNRFDESVKFIRELGQWDFYHNISFVEPIQFSGTNVSVNAAASRTNLGLGATDNVTFGGQLLLTNPAGGGVSASINLTNGINFTGSLAENAKSFTRSNLGLGATNQVTFGRLYISNTNIGAFEGLANLIANNNTAISNETLFRVGVAEATNKSAQFGFRSTNTNGDGVAVFSTFGYNALMMIGPSARSQTNAAVEADIYSVSPTNKVMTLVTTNTGATLFHRPIEFNNTTNQAVTRTNIGLGDGISTNLDIKLNDNSGMRLYFHNGILTNAVTPIP